MIETDQFSVAQNANGKTTFIGLQVTDSDPQHPLKPSRSPRQPETGGGNADQFVFAPTSDAAAVQHTITDFAPGLDKIDIRQFGDIGSLADIKEAQQGSDTLLTLDSHDSLLLKNLTVANLHASDFIISAHGA